MKTNIKEIKARKIFNSRGESTIEAEVHLDDSIGCFSAPSGASVGKNEVKAFPDEGVEASLEIIKEEISPRLEGINIYNQDKIDSELKKIDGTDNFSRLGGNASIAVSIASAKAASKNSNIPLFEYISEISGSDPSFPLPLGNIIEGGKHAGYGSTEIQEFLILPLNPDSVYEAVFVNTRVHKTVGEKLSIQFSNFSGGKGDEGGWVAPLHTEKALDILRKSCDSVEEKYGIELGVGMDIAASEIWNGNSYDYRRIGDLSESEQMNFMQSLSERYNLVYLEDPIHEENFEGFATLTNRIGENTLICGDDLFVTNKHRIREGISKKSANTVLIKPNQIGTLTDMIDAVNLAKENRFRTVVSHRSGETTDSSIAHIAVAMSDIIKTGAVGGERIAKLNELIRIEEENKDMIKMFNLRC